MKSHIIKNIKKIKDRSSMSGTAQESSLNSSRDRTASSRVGGGGLGHSLTIQESPQSLPMKGGGFEMAEFYKMLDPKKDAGIQRRGTASVVGYQQFKINGRRTS